MSLTAAVCGVVVIHLFMPVMSADSHWGVTYTSTRMCVSKGSTVEISSRYTYPLRINGRHTTVLETSWFIKVQDKEPVDVRRQSELAGRVEYDCKNNTCTLRITDVRESDSAEFRFRFITNQPDGSYTGSAGVTLTVTGFQVKALPRNRCLSQTCTYSTLQCLASCDLDQTSYIWYKNGQEIKKETSLTYSDYFYPADSYSCAVKGHEDIPSDPVCGHGSKCSSVWYTDRSICAFRGSSVQIRSSYNGHRTITSKLWFIPGRGLQWQSPSQPATDSQYGGRVQVLDRGFGRSTLRISDLRQSDSAQYRFRFTAGGFDWGSSSPGTTLTVTEPDLQVLVVGSATGPQLMCHSSCLTDRVSFVWYKNGAQLPGETSPSYAGAVGPADSYSCAYEGHRSPPVYAPQPPSVSVSPSGEIVEGSSVTLTCSSDANPAAKYTWYKENDDSPKASGQNFTITDFRAEHRGNCYCEAQNERGSSHSTSLLGGTSDFLVEWKSVTIGSLTAVLLLIALLVLLLWIGSYRPVSQWCKKGRRADNTAQVGSVSDGQPAGRDDDLLYASIHMSQSQDYALYSNIRAARPRRQRQEEEHEVLYAAVQFKTKSPEEGRQDSGEASFPTYSVVNKFRDTA